MAQIEREFFDVITSVDSTNAADVGTGESKITPSSTADAIKSGSHSPNIADVEDVPVAVKKIRDWFNAWHNVVWTGNAKQVDGHTVESNVPSGAVFTDTHITTAAISSGTAYLVGVSSATGNQEGLTKSDVTFDSTGVLAAPTFQAATSLKVKSGTTYYYTITKNSSNPSGNISLQLPNSSGTLLSTGNTSVTQVMSSGVQIASITINGGTPVDIYAPAGSGNTRYTFDSQTTTQPSAGTAYFGVTPSTDGSAETKQYVPITGLGSMAYETKTDYVSQVPDTVNNFFDGEGKISSVYLPSYVDDVIEGIYKPSTDTFYPADPAPTFTLTSSEPANWSTNYIDYYTREGTSPNYTYNRITTSVAPTWEANKYYSMSTTATAITPTDGKIYVDIYSTPSEPFRWSGSKYVSIKSPDIDAVTNITASSDPSHTNPLEGWITVTKSNGQGSTEVKTFEHPTTAGNKHIPSGGQANDISLNVSTSASTGKFFLAYGSSSGTAAWTKVGLFDTSHSGFVPVGEAVPSTPDPVKFLRSDASWSTEPVTTRDKLVLHIVPANPTT